VVLDFECTGEASLEDAKRLAIDWMHRAPQFWEAAFELSEWEGRIVKAPTMEALCDLFA